MSDTKTDPASVEAAAYTENAAKIAAETVVKFTKDESAPSGIQVAGNVAPTPTGEVVTPPQPAPSPAPVAPPAPDGGTEKLLARLAQMEAELAAVRAARQEAPKPAEANISGFTPDDLANDLVGTLKRAGVPAQDAARAILAAVAPDALNPTDRSIAATQGRFLTLQSQLNEALGRISSLQTEMRRAEYRGGVQEFVPTITEADYPALARAAKNDPKSVITDILAEVQSDAAKRAKSDPSGAPLSPSDAAKRIEARLQADLKRLGLSVSSQATAQPAQVAATPASKPVPIVPAATALPGAPPTSTAAMSYDETVTRILKEVIAKYDSSAGTN